MPTTVTVTVTDPTPEQFSILKDLAGPTTTIDSKPTPVKKVPATPAPEPEAEPEEDLLGGTPTLEDAVGRATKLVAAGKTADVKEALTAAGVKRVSELSGDKISKFMAALDG